MPPLLRRRTLVQRYPSTTLVITWSRIRNMTSDSSHLTTDILCMVNKTYSSVIMSNYTHIESRWEAGNPLSPATIGIEKNPQRLFSLTASIDRVPLKKQYRSWTALATLQQTEHIDSSRSIGFFLKWFVLQSAIHTAIVVISSTKLA